MLHSFTHLHLDLGPIPHAMAPAIPNNTPTTHQTIPGVLATTILYRPLKNVGETMRINDSKTLNAPNNCPTCDGGTRLVISDLIVGGAMAPNAPTPMTIFKKSGKLIR